MFWNRNKTVRVELVNPALLVPPSTVSHSHSPQSGEISAPEPVRPRANADLAFKLIGYGVIVLQAVFIIYGYSVLVGHYEQYGIDTSELELGTPTLLIHGYTYVFSDAISTASSIPLLGPFAVGLIFIAFGAVLVFCVMRRARVEVIIVLSCWAGLLLLMMFFAPALGVQKGAKEGRDEFTRYTDEKVPLGLTKHHTITTDKGEKLSGDLILADLKSSFLLVGHTVYKIDNATNRVMRETLLSKKEAPDVRSDK